MHRWYAAVDRPPPTQVYRWEQCTIACPVFPGPHTAVCSVCGLEKWKHHVMAFYVCDGAGLCNILCGPERKPRSWKGKAGCRGCRGMLAKLATEWYAHR